MSPSPGGSRPPKVTSCRYCATCCHRRNRQKHRRRRQQTRHCRSREAANDHVVPKGPSGGLLENRRNHNNYASNNSSRSSLLACHLCDLDKVSHSLGCSRCRPIGEPEEQPDELDNTKIKSINDNNIKIDTENDRNLERSRQISEKNPQEAASSRANDKEEEEEAKSEGHQQTPLPKIRLMRSLSSHRRSRLRSSDTTSSCRRQRRRTQCSSRRGGSHRAKRQRQWPNEGPSTGDIANTDIETAAKLARERQEQSNHQQQRLHNESQYGTLFIDGRRVAKRQRKWFRCPSCRMRFDNEMLLGDQFSRSGSSWSSCQCSAASSSPSRSRPQSAPATSSVSASSSSITSLCWSVGFSSLANSSVSASCFSLASLGSSSSSASLSCSSSSSSSSSSSLSSSSSSSSLSLSLASSRGCSMGSSASGWSTSCSSRSPPTAAPSGVSAAAVIARRRSSARSIGPDDTANNNNKRSQRREIAAAAAAAGRDRSRPKIDDSSWRQPEGELAGQPGGTRRARAEREKQRRSHAHQPDKARQQSSAPIEPLTPNTYGQPDAAQANRLSAEPSRALIQTNHLLSPMESRGSGSGWWAGPSGQMAARALSCTTESAGGELASQLAAAARSKSLSTETPPARLLHRQTGGVPGAGNQPVQRTLSRSQLVGRVLGRLTRGAIRQIKLISASNPSLGAARPRSPSPENAPTQWSVGGIGWQRRANSQRAGRTSGRTRAGQLEIVPHKLRANSASSATTSALNPDSEFTSDRSQDQEPENEEDDNQRLLYSPGGVYVGPGGVISRRQLDEPPPGRPACSGALNRFFRGRRREKPNQQQQHQPQLPAVLIKLDPPEPTGAPSLGAERSRAIAEGRQIEAGSLGAGAIDLTAPNRAQSGQQTGQLVGSNESRITCDVGQHREHPELGDGEPDGHYYYCYYYYHYRETDQGREEDSGGASGRSATSSVREASGGDRYITTKSAEKRDFCQQPKAIEEGERTNECQISRAQRQDRCVASRSNIGAQSRQLAAFPVSSTPRGGGELAATNTTTTTTTTYQGANETEEEEEEEEEPTLSSSSIFADKQTQQKQQKVQSKYPQEPLECQLARPHPQLSPAPGEQIVVALDQLSSSWCSLSADQQSASGLPAPSPGRPNEMSVGPNAASAWLANLRSAITSTGSEPVPSSTTTRVGNLTKGSTKKAVSASNSSERSHKQGSLGARLIKQAVGGALSAGDESPSNGAGCGSRHLAIGELAKSARSSSLTGLHHAQISQQLSRSSLELNLALQSALAVIEPQFVVSELAVISSHHNHHIKEDDSNNQQQRQDEQMAGKLSESGFDVIATPTRTITSRRTLNAASLASSCVHCQLIAELAANPDSPYLNQLLSSQEPVVVAEWELHHQQPPPPLMQVSTAGSGSVSNAEAASPLPIKPSFVLTSCSNQGTIDNDDDDDNDEDDDDNDAGQDLEQPKSNIVAQIENKSAPRHPQRDRRLVGGQLETERDDEHQKAELDIETSNWTETRRADKMHSKRISGRRGGRKSDHITSLMAANNSSSSIASLVSNRAQIRDGPLGSSSSERDELEPEEMDDAPEVAVDDDDDDDDHQTSDDSNAEARVRVLMASSSTSSGSSNSSSASLSSSAASSPSGSSSSSRSSSLSAFSINSSRSVSRRVSRRSSRSSLSSVSASKLSLESLEYTVMASDDDDLQPTLKSTCGPEAIDNENSEKAHQRRRNIQVQNSPTNSVKTAAKTKEGLKSASNPTKATNNTNTNKHHKKVASNKRSLKKGHHRTKSDRPEVGSKKTDKKKRQDRKQPTKGSANTLEVPKQARSASLDAPYLLTVPRRHDVDELGGNLDGSEQQVGVPKSNRSRSVDISLPTRPGEAYVVRQASDQPTSGGSGTAGRLKTSEHHSSSKLDRKKLIQGEINVPGADGETRSLKLYVNWNNDAINGQHLWFCVGSSSEACYVGENECLKHGPRLCCSSCKITAHTGCIGILVDKIKFMCKHTFTDLTVANLRNAKEPRQQNVIYHHWVHKRTHCGRCKQCAKTFGSTKLPFSSKEIQAITCSWCKVSYHNKENCYTLSVLTEPCTLGAHRESIIPPTWIFKLSDASFNRQQQLETSGKQDQLKASVINSSISVQEPSSGQPVSSSMDSSISRLVQENSNKENRYSSLQNPASKQPSVRRQNQNYGSSATISTETSGYISTDGHCNQIYSNNTCSTNLNNNDINFDSNDNVLDQGKVVQHFVDDKNPSHCPSLASDNTMQSFMSSDQTTEVLIDPTALHAADLSLINQANNNLLRHQHPNRFSSRQRPSNIEDGDMPPSSCDQDPNEEQSMIVDICVPSYQSTINLPPDPLADVQCVNFRVVPQPVRGIPNAGSKPVLVFVNPRSGGNQGAKMMQKFNWLLNPRQVFDLIQSGGPRAALELYRDVPNLRILTIGGDGTASWLLSDLDEVGISNRIPVAVLPLGTGNDLARALGWGGGFADEPIAKILTQVRDGEIVQLDRWNLQVERNTEATPSSPNDYSSSSYGGATCSNNSSATVMMDTSNNSPSTTSSPSHFGSLSQVTTGTSSTSSILNRTTNCDTTMIHQQQYNNINSAPSASLPSNFIRQIDEDGTDRLPMDVINNYFSFGVDAHIALEFHTAREAHPERFNSRLRNKMFYGQAGGKDLLRRKWKDLSNFVTLYCDGQDMTGRLKELRVHSVLFLNIPSYGGGTRPWPTTTTSFAKPRTDDGLIEVIGLTTYQLPLLQAGGHGTCIAQCRSAKIVTSRTIPMQVDGEPCKLLPSVININFKNRVCMLAKSKSSNKSANNYTVGAGIQKFN